MFWILWEILLHYIASFLNSVLCHRSSAHKCIYGLLFATKGFAYSLLFNIIKKNFHIYMYNKYKYIIFVQRKMIDIIVILISWMLHREALKRFVERGTE